MYLVPALLALSIYVGDLSYDPLYRAVDCPPGNQSVSRTDTWTGADGHEYKETNCYNSETGERISGQCCCFVASASGLNPDEIDDLRQVRDVLNKQLVGFKPLVSDTYDKWGPQVAGFLRTNEPARRLTHDLLSPIARVAGRFNDFARENGNHSQTKAQRAYSASHK